MSHVWASELIADMISRLFASDTFIVFVHVELTKVVKSSGRVTLSKLITGVGEIELVRVIAMNTSEELMCSKALVNKISRLDEEL